MPCSSWCAASTLTVSCRQCLFSGNGNRLAGQEGCRDPRFRPCRGEPADCAGAILLQRAYHGRPSGNAPRPGPALRFSGLKAKHGTGLALGPDDFVEVALPARRRIPRGPLPDHRRRFRSRSGGSEARAGSRSTSSPRRCRRPKPSTSAAGSTRPPRPIRSRCCWTRTSARRRSRPAGRATGATRCRSAATRSR